MKRQNPRLLIVEDSVDDENLILRALKRMDREFDVEVAHDGEEAINRLCKHSTTPLPNLVILDWKLPRQMGVDVLKRIRREPQCKDVVVVAFSSSDDPRDRAECEQCGGDAYVSKPVEYHKFLLAVQCMVLRYGPSLADGIGLSHSTDMEAEIIPLQQQPTASY